MAASTTATHAKRKVGKVDLYISHHNSVYAIPSSLLHNYTGTTHKTLRNNFRRDLSAYVYICLTKSVRVSSVLH